MEFEINVWQEDAWMVAVYPENEILPVWFEQFDTEQEAERAAQEYIKEQQNE